MMAHGFYKILFFIRTYDRLSPKKFQPCSVSSNIKDNHYFSFSGSEWFDGEDGLRLELFLDNSMHVSRTYILYAIFILFSIFVLSTGSKCNYLTSVADSIPSVEQLYCIIDTLDTEIRSLRESGDSDKLEPKLIETFRLPKVPVTIFCLIDICFVVQLIWGKKLGAEGPDGEHQCFLLEKLHSR